MGGSCDYRHATPFITDGFTNSMKRAVAAASAAVLAQVLPMPALLLSLPIWLIRKKYLFCALLPSLSLSSLFLFTRL